MRPSSMQITRVATRKRAGEILLDEDDRRARGCSSLCSES